MEYYNNIVCVTYEDLTVGFDGEPAIMSRAALDKMLSRGEARRMQKGGGLGSYVLIEYNSLPSRYRQRFEALHGHPADILKKQSMKDLITIDSAARVWFEAYRYDKAGVETALTTDMINEYVINASVLNELLDILNDRRGYLHSLGMKTTHIWESITGTVETLRDRYEHTLPKSTARLKEKIQQYKKDGYSCLISGKIGNDNTLKITEEVGSKIIALKRCAIPVYTEAQIFAEINRIAEVRGWRPLKSVQSLHMFLERADIKPLWYDAVYGERAAFQRYGRKHKTEMPSVRDALWYGDGTKLNLYYKEATASGAWTIRTTSVYEVIDAYSEVLLGYHISDTEDYEQQYNAYRMAVQFSGHRPFELVHDNQGGHKKADNTDLFSKICRVHRTTAPYSPQSKTIESVFGRFQQQILHKDWRFTGQNITAKRDGSRPNLERIEANIENLYTLKELKAAYAAARQEWNEMSHPATDTARIEMYNSSVNTQTPVITNLDMVDIFWLSTDRPSTFTDSGILITIKGKEYRYEVFSAPGQPDMQWRRLHTGEKFITRYDPYDMSQVRLYKQEADGSLRFVVTAEPYMVIHRAIQEQTEGEMSFIRHQVEVNREERIERQVQVRLIEEAHGVALEQQGLNRPALKGAADSREEIELRLQTRRARKYDRSSADIGPVNKVISNITFDQLQQDNTFNERLAASKI